MVNEILRTQLNDEIQSEIENLGDLTPGSNEHTAAVKSVAELYKLTLDENKNETENSLKLRQLNDVVMAERRQSKDRWLTVIANGAISLVTLGLTFTHEHNLANKCLKFEETGSFQSLISKGLFGKVLRKR